MPDAYSNPMLGSLVTRTCDVCTTEVMMKIKQILQSTWVLECPKCDSIAHAHADRTRLYVPPAPAPAPAKPAPKRVKAKKPIAKAQKKVQRRRKTAR